MSIADGIYESGWFRHSHLCQKWLLLIFLRSRKAEKLTLYKFTRASRLCFSNVSVRIVRYANARCRIVEILLRYIDI